MSKVTIYPEPSRGWWNVNIGKYKWVTLNGYDAPGDEGIVWYNLGYNKAQDHQLIRFFIKNQIPFQFLPNGAFPRLQMEAQYFIPAQNP